MIKIGKYEFDTKEAYTQAFNLATNKTQHSFVELGNIEVADGFSNKYHVDVLWAFDDEEESHPESFANKKIDLNNDGVHGFAGVDYLTHKI